MCGVAHVTEALPKVPLPASGGVLHKLELAAALQHQQWRRNTLVKKVRGEAEVGFEGVVLVPARVVVMLYCPSVSLVLPTADLPYSRHIYPVQYTCTGGPVKIR